MWVHRKKKIIFLSSKMVTNFKVIQYFTEYFAEICVLQVWVQMRQPPALLFSPDDEGVQGPPDSLLRRGGGGGGLGPGAGTAGVRAHGHRAGRPRSRGAHLGHLLHIWGGRVLVHGVVAETHGHAGLMLVWGSTGGSPSICW